MDNLVQFEEDFNSRTEMWWWSGPDGYLRPDQFLDHLTVIITTPGTVWQGTRILGTLIYNKKFLSIYGKQFSYSFVPC